MTSRPPATVDVTFWLSSRRDRDVVIPEGTEVATERSPSVEAVVFRTQRDLTVVSVEVAAVGSQSAAANSFQDLTATVGSGMDVALFSPTPQVGDVFYVGLSQPAPSCVVAVVVAGDVEGHGVLPDNPPRVWQAWTGGGWEECDIERDETGGFNQEGVVVLHLPAGHAALKIGDRTAPWLRCVVTDTSPDQSPYGASPRINRIDAYTIGGTVEAVHCEEVLNEDLGLSEGVHGQSFQLEHHPVVLAPSPEVIEEYPTEHDGSTSAEQPIEWTRVDSFATADHTSRCFSLDPTTGEVRFPPIVREPDGGVRSFGDRPAAGSRLRIRAYRSGGGRIGNVAAHSIRRLRESVPGVASVDNRRSAGGGVDAESVDEAKTRGPLTLRTRDRAVTASDFEYLARAAAPEVSRVMCPDVSLGEPGTVRVLVVPHVHGPEEGPLQFEQLHPGDATLDRIKEELDVRRVVGVRVVVEPPAYQGLTVVARLQARRHENPTEVQQRALEALYRYYHPVVGGPEGRGWPFGRPIHAAEVFGVLQQVRGVELVVESSLYAYDLERGDRNHTELDHIDLGPTSLPYSHNHKLIVEGMQ